MCDIDDDGELVSAYRSYWRKARKEHKCIACCETILKGNFYRYSSGVFDGTGFSEKHCARCWAIIEAIRAQGVYVIDPLLDCGQIWDDVFEEPPPDNVAALAFMTVEEAQRLVK